MKIFHRLRRFASLDRADKILVVEAMVVSLLVSFSFRTAGVPRTQARLRRWSETGLRRRELTEAQAVIARSRRAQAMVRRGTGLGGRCLARSLTLWTLLRRRGISADLRVGYRKRDNRIEGHAWLEYCGLPVNESASVIESYTVSAEPAAFDEWKRIT